MALARGLAGLEERLFRANLLQQLPPDLQSLHRETTGTLPGMLPACFAHLPSVLLGAVYWPLAPLALFYNLRNLNQELS